LRICRLLENQRRCWDAAIVCTQVAWVSGNLS
jgi:hypothetical protein